MKRSLLTLIPVGLAFFGSGGAAAGAPPITARQVIERIQKNVGIPWQAETVDTFKAGDPDTPVTGIATTFMATMEVLQRTAASGKNLIIVHEPVFYNHRDETAGFETDAVYKAKRAFIAQHGLVIWRFHDHWHAHKPDGVLTGMTHALGWEKYQRSANEPLYVLPETTLERLAADLRNRLKIRAIRVIGDPGMKLTKAGLSMGASGADAQIKALERDDVEVLLIGETTEWETIAYVRDAVTEGKRKALILLGHVPSEEAGMEYCARWLKTFVTEVPIEFIPAGEPFWGPK